MMKKKVKYSFFNNLCFSVKKLEASAFPFFLVTFLIILLPEITSYFTTRITSKIVDLFAEKSYQAIIYTLIWGGLSFLLSFLSGLLNKVGCGRFGTLHMSFERILFKKRLHTDYENLENPDYATLYQKALNDCSSGCAPLSLIRLSSKLFISILAVFAYAEIISHLSLWLIGVTAIYLVLTFFIGIMLDNYAEHFQNDLTEINRKENYLLGISSDYSFAKDVRLYHLQSLILPELVAVQTARIIIKRKIENKKFLFLLLLSLAGAAQQCALYYFILKEIEAGVLSPGSFLLFSSSVGLLSSALGNVFQMISSLHLNNLKTRYYREFLDIPEIRSKGTKKLSEAPSVISFENVCYRFPSAENDTIHGVSFSIKKGEKIALVGLNGSGKTTLVKLLCGLYSPSSGEILANGIPVQDICIDEYYSYFSPVFQDLHLLPVSIKEMIVSDFTNADRDSNYDEKRLNEAISRSGLSAKIDSLKNGIDTRLVKGVYDDGIDLSGGEIQKLMLARAIYKGAPFVVLDEPTSAMDPISEKHLYEQYNTIFEGKTVLFISHRMASTRFCDRIILLSEGKIIETGTYDELMQMNGVYASMFNAQKQYYVE